MLMLIIDVSKYLCVSVPVSVTFKLTKFVLHSTTNPLESAVRLDFVC